MNVSGIRVTTRDGDGICIDAAFLHRAACGACAVKKPTIDLDQTMKMTVVKGQTPRFQIEWEVQAETEPNLKFAKVRMEFLLTDLVAPVTLRPRPPRGRGAKARSYLERAIMCARPLRQTIDLSVAEQVIKQGTMRRVLCARWRKLGLFTDGLITSSAALPDSLLQVLRSCRGSEGNKVLDDVSVEVILRHTHSKVWKELQPVLGDKLQANRSNTESDEKSVASSSASEPPSPHNTTPAKWPAWDDISIKGMHLQQRLGVSLFPPVASPIFPRASRRTQLTPVDQDDVPTRKRRRLLHESIDRGSLRVGL